MGIRIRRVRRRRVKKRGRGGFVRARHPYHWGGGLLVCVEFVVDGVGLVVAGFFYCLLIYKGGGIVVWLLFRARFIL